jgi:hypothetical protein
MADLNSLIPAGSGWVLTGASAINDSGGIVGTGVVNGQAHAFLLTPTTTTTALALLAISLPLGTTAGSTDVPGSDTPVNAILASSPRSVSSSFGSAAAFDSLWLSQSVAAAAGATNSAVPISETPPFVTPLTGDLSPADQADSFQPALASKAGDPLFANLDSEMSTLFVDDLAWAAWGSDGWTLAPA